MNSWPTPVGWITVGAAAVLISLGAFGNNLLVLIASVLWALLLMDLRIGRENLSGVRAAWNLPKELFADRAARGGFTLINTSSTAAQQVIIEDSATSAQGGVAPLTETTIRAWWRPQQRGRWVLTELRLRSRFPLGFFEHTHTHRDTAEVIVYPSPCWTDPTKMDVSAGDLQPIDTGRGQGDVSDLRPYRDGDPVQRIHWRTTARVGSPMVLTRADHQQRSVLIPLPSDRPLDSALQAATGTVLRALDEGLSVGLLLPGHPELADPKRGTGWRRTLLTALATYNP